MLKKLFIAMLMLAPVSLCAQKFAHYDFQAVIEAMPAYTAAQTELKELGEKYTANQQDMEKEITTKREKYSKEAADAEAAGKPLPENILKRYSEELQKLYESYQQAIDDNQKAFQEAQAQKLQPILAQVLAAVQDVAKAGGYVYVFDTQSAQSPQLVINTALSEDVTAQVKAKLNVK